MKKTHTKSKKTKINNELRDRILKISTLEDTSMLLDSIVFSKKDMITTPVPMMNVALSGSFDGGLLPGALMIAGPSKHFKTLFGLLLVFSFLQQYPDGIVLFYDSEFGTPKQYFKLFGIDESRVIHSPVAVVEDMTTDILNQVNAIEKGEHVLILVDSIGNLASSKELDDATAGKDKTDMTRAKKIKALFRMLISKINLKGIPMIVINHTYKTLDLFSKDVVGGGTGPIYGTNDIWIVGRQQDKDGKVLEGFNFIIRIEKSRTVKEKSQIPIEVSFESGIQKWSGFLDLAIEAGIVQQSGIWYNIAETRFRRNEIEYNGEIWQNLMPQLQEYVEKKYKLPEGIIINEDKVESETVSE